MSQLESESSPGCRRFNLGDGMILIAALAPGMFGGPIAAQQLVRHLRGLARSRPMTVDGFWAMLAALGRHDAALILRDVWSLSILFVLCLTWAQLVFRVRRPRPSWEQILQQPGTLGCLATTASVLLMLVLPYLRRQSPHVWLLVIGWAAPVGWAALALVRRWRPERGWFDQLGIMLCIWWALIAGSSLFVRGI
jgi:hypothetical protein